MLCVYYLNNSACCIVFDYCGCYLYFVKNFCREYKKHPHNPTRSTLEGSHKVLFRGIRGIPNLPSTKSFYKSQTTHSPTKDITHNSFYSIVF